MKDIPKKKPQKLPTHTKNRKSSRIICTQKNSIEYAPCVISAVHVQADSRNMNSSVKRIKIMFIRTQFMYTPKQHVNYQNNAKPVVQIQTGDLAFEYTSAVWDLLQYDIIFPMYFFYWKNDVILRERGKKLPVTNNRCAFERSFTCLYLENWFSIVFDHVLFERILRLCSNKYNFHIFREILIPMNHVSTISLYC